MVVVLVVVGGLKIVRVLFDCVVWLFTLRNAIIVLCLGVGFATGSVICKNCLKGRGEGEGKEGWMIKLMRRERGDEGRWER